MSHLKAITVVSTLAIVMSAAAAFAGTGSHALSPPTLLNNNVKADQPQLINHTVKHAEELREERERRRAERQLRRQERAKARQQRRFRGGGSF